MSEPFDEREKAFEAKWAHDEELRFKVMARRNRLLGHWAAGEMGLSRPKAEDYAKAVVEAGLTGKGKDPVFEKIRGDFAAAKISRSDHMLQRKLEELLTLAGEQIVHERKA